MSSIHKDVLHRKVIFLCSIPSNSSTYFSIWCVPIHHVYTISFTLLRCLGISLLSIEYIPVALAKWCYQFGYYAALVDEHCLIRSEMSGFQMEQQNRHR